MFKYHIHFHAYDNVCNQLLYCLIIIIIKLTFSFLKINFISLSHKIKCKTYVYLKRSINDYYKINKIQILETHYLIH